ncbi:MAG TPA: indole-3-glycerol phosphate synthase TrpC [Firmicutes bacterium]|nr:indole-3-glycerol phosphate synthase TrpC [Bacillota bacterium]
MLAKILQAKREAVDLAKQVRPLEKMMVALKPGEFRFRKALREKPWSLIAECKLASPAKGRLCDRHTVSELAQIYTRAGAAALSVLTDAHFCGRLAHIGEVKQVSRLPVLRKDFVLDAYQLYEARSAGADAVLLIAAILTDEQLRTYLALTESLGMDVLVEVHTPAELARVQRTSALIVGINNRDLTRFVTDVNITLQLMPACEQGRLIISESGIFTGEDVRRLRKAGVRGALVGEGLVKAADIAAKTGELAMLNDHEDRK